MKKIFTKRMHENAQAIAAMVSFLKTVKPKDRKFVCKEVRSFFDKQFKWPR